MKIGDKVLIRQCKYFPALNGLEGTIVDIGEYAGEPTYKIVAENDGPFMVGRESGTTKIIRAWKKGNTTERRDYELKKLT